MNKPKIAIFYDWLNNWGGAERVLLNLLELYPQADIFTLVHDPSITTWLPKSHQIHTSFLNNFPFAKSNPICYTPFYNLAIEQFDFSGYDIVISTTSTIGHGLLVPPQSLYLCYFHNLNRHIYLNPPRLLLPLLNIYKKFDQIYINRPDAYVCNSQTVAARLAKFYKLKPTIINPGVNINLFPLSRRPRQKFFLVVGRQVRHKRIDLVILYFLKHPNKKLVVAGNGRQHAQLVTMANRAPNITFIVDPSDTKLVELYQSCLALICPQEEDFGLTPIEAQLCGTPVIAYGRGGNTETIIDNQTGIFFDRQTVGKLENAIQRFLKTTFSSIVCRHHALKFSDKNFMLNFSHYLNKLWLKHQTTIS